MPYTFLVPYMPLFTQDNSLTHNSLAIDRLLVESFFGLNIKSPKHAYLTSIVLPSDTSINVYQNISSVIEITLDLHKKALNKFKTFYFKSRLDHIDFDNVLKGTFKVKTSSKNFKKLYLLFKKNIRNTCYILQTKFIKLLFKEIVSLLKKYICNITLSFQLINRLKGSKNFYNCKCILSY